MPSRWSRVRRQCAFDSPRRCRSPVSVIGDMSPGGWKEAVHVASEMAGTALLARRLLGPTHSPRLVGAGRRTVDAGVWVAFRWARPCRRAGRFIGRRPVRWDGGRVRVAHFGARGGDRRRDRGRRRRQASGRGLGSAAFRAGPACRSLRRGRAMASGFFPASAMLRRTRGAAAASRAGSASGCVSAQSGEIVRNPRRVATAPCDGGPCRSSSVATFVFRVGRRLPR